MTRRQGPRDYHLRPTDHSYAVAMTAVEMGYYRTPRGCTLRDIGRKLECSPAAVKKHLTRVQNLAVLFAVETSLAEREEAVRRNMDLMAMALTARAGRVRKEAADLADLQARFVEAFPGVQEPTIFASVVDSPRLTGAGPGSARQGHHWRVLDGLDPPARDALAALLACYPGGLSKAILAPRIGFTSHTHRGFQEVVQRLRNLGFVSGGATLMASAALFVTPKVPPVAGGQVRSGVEVDA